MASAVLRHGGILDLIDDTCQDRLPYKDVAIPLNELPEPEEYNGLIESVKEQKLKWTDLAS
uniref:anaphase-promoting complex subunit 13-like n=1 Tax=Nyctereutes procyonoides TaxID=34880 RepID=UPI002444CC21|nr:anaphase-promoting complex subunit 13-like [Nyctereutes procyonoides]